MTDPSAEFFAALNERGHEPLLEKTSGTIRVDLVSGEQIDHWLIIISKGDIAVSHDNLEADCVIYADKELFDRVASGEANATAMVLRGAVSLQGKVELLVLFQRLFPGPPSQREQPATAGYARRHT